MMSQICTKGEKISRILQKTSKIDKNSLYLWLRQDWIDILDSLNKKDLNKLTLWKCNIRALDMNLMIENQWVNLKILNLAENKIGSKGVKLLTKFYMPKLQILGLGDCMIQNEGINNVGKGNWPYLKQLRIYKNEGTNGYLEKIKHLKTKQLSYLQIHRDHYNDRRNDPIFLLQLILFWRWGENFEISYSIKGNYIRNQIYNIFLTKFSTKFSTQQD